MIASTMMRTSVMLLLLNMVSFLVGRSPANFPIAYVYINLVGVVLLFMFGLYYRVVPAARQSTVAKTQGWLHIAGAVLLLVGAALLNPLDESTVIVSFIGWLVAIVAVALFAIIVFRTSRD
ncbi:MULTISPECIES: hypothetical protein [unclassified Nitrobacter]|uniref:hypothetical protein n=1 Tax=unclassified Nitrobacter TaxID=2620411 RepID=UPI00092852C2|nr:MULTISPECIES: hypothetical protein [unclassified Nitrobacter]MBN9147729.1 hypothetical protein [Nitrobacter sp.]OJV03656.1 MAG: hypothetical protein BGO16_01420 [Nitrobacter sp. 62-23]